MIIPVKDLPADLMKTAEAIRDVIMQANLDEAGKRRVLQRLRDYTNGNIKSLDENLGHHHLKLGPEEPDTLTIGKRERDPIYPGMHHECADELRADLLQWVQGGIRMERPVGSAMHKLREAWLSGKALAPIFSANSEFNSGKREDIFAEAQTFIVEHDWHGAFKNATDFEGGEFRFPYEKTCFEFRFSGRRVIALMAEATEDSRPDPTVPVYLGPLCIPFVESPYGWAMPDYIYSVKDGGQEWGALVGRSAFERLQLSDDDLRFKPLIIAIADQVRAVCIALEAEAAEAEVVRAPYKLNAKREKAGKLPIYDHHIVRLHRRVHRAPLPLDQQSHGERRRPRLHFVRGHWRHYTGHKTWIKWYFRGDPDLGFIDKEYRL